ncbi:N-alpha-acetyltransferase 35 NatC auxiliary subunit [Xylographa soralifera]|nr:N-alpha-acetyltransferase 35 NatC auxiliary subunit [Xylographa soralifera]
MDFEGDAVIKHEASQLQVDDHANITDRAQQYRPSSSIPRVLNKQKEAHDISEDFTRAAEALGTGQLIKDEFFTLFEAVGALEIMDPKMDSGCLAPGEKLEEDYDILQELLPEEVVGIIDQLLCAEVAWYMGHHLSQTLFSSLYIDRLLWPEPKSLDQATFHRNGTAPLDNVMLHVVLRAYCLGLIKTCYFVHKKIVSETYYEEEDFVSNLYNRRLLPDPNIDDIEDLLDQAIWLIESKQDLCSNHIREALTSRFMFRKRFLRAVALDLCGSKEEYAASWRNCSSALPSLLDGSKHSSTVPQSFSAKIQRRFASTVPPRPVMMNDLKDTHDYLQRLFDDAEEAGELVLPADILVDMANYTVEAPQSRKFQIAKRMDVFVGRVGQSYLDTLRAMNMNRSRMRRMLCHTILDWENIQLDAEEIDMSLREYTHEEPIAGQTPEEEDVWSFPLSSWSYYHKLHQMEWVVQLGFELHIYRTDELAGMYWYLQYLANFRLQHLQRIRTFTLRRKDLVERPTPEQTAAFSQSLSFLSFSMLEASATQSFADALSCTSWDQSFHIFEGFADIPLNGKLYISLVHLSLLPASLNFPYSTPAFRYSLRMRPFFPISIPSVPSYEEFSSLVDPLSVYPEDRSALGKSLEAKRLDSLLEAAELATKIARKEWEAVSKSSAETARCQGCEKEWKVKQKDVLRSVIAGGIAIAGVRKWVAGGMKAGKLKVEVDEKGYHDWWVVPKVKAL